MCNVSLNIRCIQYVSIVVIYVCDISHIHTSRYKCLLVIAINIKTITVTLYSAHLLHKQVLHILEDVPKYYAYHLKTL